MVKLFENTLKSVSAPPTLIVLIPPEQYGWCQQFSEEGYDVFQLDHSPNSEEEFVVALKEAFKKLSAQSNQDWAFISYGIGAKFLTHVREYSSSGTLRTCIHFLPQSVNGKDLLLRQEDGHFVPTIFHLTSAQLALHESLIEVAEAGNIEHPPRTSEYPRVAVHVYPKVPESPPFPFLMKAPALVRAGEKSSTDPYIRSATGISYTRTLELLRRELGPHFELEKLWEKHTFYEFVERNALKTMSTMVSAPYVNHVPTMTGGVGFDDLARFYKYHFTREDVTPPDTELITVSRTVGADRIIDEMIFKCTHTTEIDYFLPGVKPTGKPLEIALVGVVNFRGDKLTFEHIYWDQASALVQLGLLSTNDLPVAGVEVARKVVDPFGLPSNSLMSKWKESEGLPIG